MRPRFQVQFLAFTLFFVANHVLLLCVSLLHAEPPAAPVTPVSKIGDVPVADVMGRLGAKFEGGASQKLLQDYANTFDRTDPNRDGKHSRKEYVEGGRYMTPQARAGIFRAADENSDGVVTRSEYVLNRIITDEGKEIIQGMDDDRDGMVEEKEFVTHTAKLLADEDLAKQLFSKLDRNKDSNLPIPEYLQQWGKWAREGRGSAHDRIQKRQQTAAARPKQNGPSATGTGTAETARPGGPPGVDEVFQRFDLDKNGKLTKTEIPEFVQQFILPADADKDGSVTKQELETFRQKNSAGRGRFSGQGRKGN